MYGLLRQHHRCAYSGCEKLAVVGNAPRMGYICQRHLARVKLHPFETQNGRKVRVTRTLDEYILDAICHRGDAWELVSTPTPPGATRGLHWLT